MITIILANDKGLLEETGPKAPPVLEPPTIEPEETKVVPSTQMPAPDDPVIMPPEVVPERKVANERDPLNRLVWKYKRYSDPNDPKYDTNRAERMRIKIMEHPFRGGDSLSDFTESVYRAVTGGEVEKTAWEVLTESKVLDKWDGDKGDFGGFYTNTVRHDAAMEKSRIDAKRAGIEASWSKQFMDAYYLQDYIEGMRTGNKEVIPEHIMNFENYAESGKAPPGWDPVEWERYLVSLRKRFTAKDKFKFDDNEKIFESSFWDRHDFRRPNRVEDAISHWNRSMDAVQNLLNENPEVREDLGAKFPKTIATKESIAEINRKAKEDAEAKGQWDPQFGSPDTTVWLVEEVPPRGRIHGGGRKFHKRNFEQTKHVFEYLSDNYPELARQAGITNETMFEKPSSGRPVTNKKEPYRGEYFLNFDMIDPFQRHYASDRMLEIQRAYMDDVQRDIPLSAFRGPQSERQMDFVDPKARTPEELAMEKEQDEDYGVFSTKRMTRFVRANETLRRAIMC